MITVTFDERRHVGGLLLASDHATVVVVEFGAKAAYAIMLTQHDLR